MNTTASLPSAVSTWCIATSEPSASPSGFSCVASTKRSRVAELGEHLRARRRGAVRAAHSPTLPLEQLVDAQAALDRVVVDEVQRRRVLEPQLAGDPALQEAVGGAQAVQRAPRARRASPSTRHVDACVAKVWDVSTAVTVTNPTRGSFRSA